LTQSVAASSACLILIPRESSGRAAAISMLRNHDVAAAPSGQIVRQIIR
jgi:hypothetical protein